MTLECPSCHSRYDVAGRPAGAQLRCRCGATISVPPPTGPGILSCPSCGAGVSPDDASCPYCRGPLALAACPRCFGRVFRGNGFCPHCGTAIAAGGAISDSPSQRICPRCVPEVEHHLTVHLVGDTLLDECQRCGGLWVDRPAFDRVVQDRQRQSKLIADGLQASPVPFQAGAAVSPVRYLPCPDCRMLMNRKNFGERSGVIVDICKPHGIWFDRDELSATLRFVMAGGLAETQRRHLEDLARQSSVARMSLPHQSFETVWQAKGIGFSDIADIVLDAVRHLFHS